MAKFLHPELYDQVELFRKNQKAGSKLFECVVDSKSPSWAIALLHKENLLDTLLPELAACRNVAQNPYHHLPVFEHTLLTLDFTERISGSPGTYFSTSERVRLAAGNERRVLILAAIGHDLGKPETREQKPDGYFTFYQHEKESQRLFSVMAKRLKVDEKQVERAGEMIRSHMHIAPVATRYFRGEATERALRKIFRKHADMWGALLIFALADSLATKGPLSSPEVAENLRDFAPVLENYENRLKNETEYRRPIDGWELMEKTGLPAGRKIGRLLSLEDKVLAKTPEISKKELMRILIESEKSF